MRERIPAFALAAVIIVLDRWTKLWIEAEVSLYDSHTVIPGFFDIVHTENRGMAFGLFSDGESAIRRLLLVGVALVVLLVVVAMLWKLPSEAGRTSRLTGSALALVLGGAIGNLYDRAIRGSVTDFLDVYLGDWHWPAFNVADSAITIGAILLAMSLLLDKNRGEES